MINIPLHAPSSSLSAQRRENIYIFFLNLTCNKTREIKETRLETAKYLFTSQNINMETGSLRSTRWRMQAETSVSGQILLHGDFKCREQGHGLVALLSREGFDWLAAQMKGHFWTKCEREPG